MRVITIPEGAYYCGWCKRCYAGMPEHHQVINTAASTEILSWEEARQQGLVFERFRCRVKKSHAKYEIVGTKMPTGSIAVAKPGYMCGECSSIYLNQAAAVKCCARKVADEKFQKAMAELEAKEEKVDAF